MGSFANRNACVANGVGPELIRFFFKWSQFMTDKVFCKTLSVDLNGGAVP
jgi:hypothetical protein